ncbi:L-methionine gamma-lyase [Actinidia chinensis var. chinensis]|uniref:L-methionine gamma-lyase n=1 Tax=Actinidia chinensis var. chinensis TaxID=1590841 RepID=A0A2R6P0S0_ACTCC|nr:L-methionine gamma-lyase [Actinidia chinensis var. chinensis]
MVTNLPNLFTCLRLFMDNCEKLVEVQGMVKFEAIGNTDLRIIEDFGLVDHLESVRSHEVKFFNNLTLTIMKRLIQGVSEFGIYSLFLPSSLVPGWCSNYKKSGSIIEFNVPSNPNLKIRALKVYMRYAYASDEGHSDWEDHWNANTKWGHHRITITNKAKGLSWSYWPIWKCFPDGNQDCVWLSHWKIGHQYLMEPGDEMIVRAFVTELYQVKEVGVEIVCDENKAEGSQHHSTHPYRHDDIDVLDLTPCLQGPGEYFLCHYFQFPYQYYYKMKLQGGVSFN